jgi:hypothetical protein
MKVARYHRGSGHILAIATFDDPAGYDMTGSVDVGVIEVSADVSSATHWINSTPNNGSTPAAELRTDMVETPTLVRTGAPGTDIAIATGMNADAWAMITGSGGIAYTPEIVRPSSGRLSRRFSTAGRYTVTSVGRLRFPSFNLDIAAPVVIDPLDPDSQLGEQGGGLLIEADPSTIIVEADARGDALDPNGEKTFTLISSSTLTNVTAQSTVCDTAVAGNVVTCSNFTRSGHVVWSADIGEETISRRVAIVIDADTSSATIDLKKRITATPTTQNWQDVVSGEITTGPPDANGESALAIGAELYLAVTAATDAFLVIKAKVMIQALGATVAATEHPEGVKTSDVIRNFEVVGGTLRAVAEPAVELRLKERIAGGLAANARYRVTLMILAESGTASLDSTSFGKLFLDGVD